ncbi:hypothetical protein DFS34DRAFT_671749 [Phlyctochytrium arcticum]|nr:hypothetical protein DFS34DRAFT_671749 [Phlyctochytrium arcticum]
MLNEFTYCSLKKRTFSIQPRHVEFMKILSVSFIQDYDLVQESNNSIAFVEDGDSLPRTARIPTGNYTIGNIGTAIGTALSSAGTQNYFTSYDGVTRKLTISTNGATDFKILEGNRGTSSYILTGMSRWNETGYGKSFTLKNPVNLSGSYPILLTSNISVKGVRFLSDFNESEQMVVCTVQPDSFGDVVTVDNSSSEFFPVDDSISKIEFHLIDSMTGNEISLNSPLTTILAIFIHEPFFFVNLQVKHTKLFMSSVSENSDNFEESIADRQVSEEKAIDEEPVQEVVQEEKTVVLAPEQAKPKRVMSEKQKAALEKARNARSRELRSMQAKRDKERKENEEKDRIEQAKRILEVEKEKKRKERERKKAEKAEKTKKVVSKKPVVAKTTARSTKNNFVTFGEEESDYDDFIEERYGNVGQDDDDFGGIFG